MQNVFNTGDSGFNNPIYIGRALIKDLDWNPEPYKTTGEQLTGAHLGVTQIQSPVLMSNIGDLIKFTPAPLATLDFAKRSYDTFTKRSVPFRGMQDVYSANLSSQLSYSHWGVGEKGPASRFHAQWLGTYEDESVVDPLKAAHLAERYHRSRNSVLGARVGLGIAATYYGMPAWNESIGDNVFARSLAFSLGAGSRYPQLIIATAIGSTAGAIYNIKQGRKNQATWGTALRSLTPLLAEGISYPTSKWLGGQVIRYNYPRLVGQHILAGGGKAYSSIGKILNSSWFTEKGEKFSEEASRIAALGTQYLGGDLEELLGKETYQGLRTVFQELLDPVVDKAAKTVVGVGVGYLANWVDARNRSNKLARKHAGPGEKGSASRYNVQRLGTYKDQSIVDVLKTAASSYAKKVYGSFSRFKAYETAEAIRDISIGSLQVRSELQTHTSLISDMLKSSKDLHRSSRFRAVVHEAENKFGLPIIQPYYRQSSLRGVDSGGSINRETQGHIYDLVNRLSDKHKQAIRNKRATELYTKKFDSLISQLKTVASSKGFNQKEIRELLHNETTNKEKWFYEKDSIYGYADRSARREFLKPQLKNISDYIHIISNENNEKLKRFIQVNKEARKLNKISSKWYMGQAANIWDLSDPNTYRFYTDDILSNHKKARSTIVSGLKDIRANKQYLLINEARRALREEGHDFIERAAHTLKIGLLHTPGSPSNLPDNIINEFLDRYTLKQKTKVYRGFGNNELEKSIEEGATRVGSLFHDPGHMSTSLLFNTSYSYAKAGGVTTNASEKFISHITLPAGTKGFFSENLAGVGKDAEFTLGKSNTFRITLIGDKDYEGIRHINLELIAQGDEATKIANSHWGPGEKGPASRYIVDSLGTYKEHSIVDVLKASKLAQRVFGKWLTKAETGIISHAEYLNFSSDFNALYEHHERIRNWYIEQQAIHKNDIFEKSIVNSKHRVIGTRHITGDQYYAEEIDYNQRLYEKENHKLWRQKKKYEESLLRHSSANQMPQYSQTLLRASEENAFVTNHADQLLRGSDVNGITAKKMVLNRKRPLVKSAKNYSQFKVAIKKYETLEEANRLSNYQAYQHHNIEQSGEQVQQHLHNVTQSFEQKSIVSPLKNVLIAELRLASTRAENSFFKLSVDKLYKHVVSKYPISKQELKRWLGNQRLSTALMRRGISKKEFQTEIGMSLIKPTSLTTEERSFMTKTERMNHLKNRRQESSLLSGKEISNRVAFDHMATEVPNVYAKKESALQLPEPEAPNSDLLMHTNSIKDTQDINTTKISPPITRVKSHVNMTITDGAVDMKRLDKILTKRLK